ncbi:excinuclease ABC subunit UvrC [Candidatus Woesearchaeota archaeon]|nr:excinuclease ABC subunit UvrC [Candidatus Woesearchaeota archaeon]
MKDFNPPTNPGCYLFKDFSGKIIYVGKAKNLKKRVASYFQSKTHSLKNQLLIGNIYDAEFIITNNEVEALLLENNLVKKHRPIYNLTLKDNTPYAYIIITDEKYPRIFSTRNKKLKGEYFGPYTEGISRHALIRLCRNMFKIRSCKTMPKKVCLNYHIGKCYGPCEGFISIEGYATNIEKAKLLLKNKDKELIKTLKGEMSVASKTQDYELALDLREQISALDHAAIEQNVEAIKHHDENIIGLAQGEQETVITLFKIKKGVISSRKEYRFDEYNRELLDTFIKLYYDSGVVPDEIITSQEVLDKKNIEKFLAKLKNKKVKITTPKKGDKKKLVELALKNAQLSLSGANNALKQLEEKLVLPSAPQVIECFDVSNIAGTSSVGAMVQFVGSEPKKDNYRRFAIKTVSGVDDYAMIAEIVRRRYLRLKEYNLLLPDLIIIDGGKGQLNAALAELRKLGLRIPIISIAKREEEIFVPGLRQAIKFNKKSEALKLLQRIRDEAHRFAINYHKLKRSKKMLE